MDELICDEEHWFQGNSGRSKPSWYGDNSHCPVTAIDHVLHGEELGAGPSYDAVRKYFGLAVPGPSVNVPYYNNADERTFPEIKALIRKARELRLADIMETVDA